MDVGRGGRQRAAMKRRLQILRRGFGLAVVALGVTGCGTFITPAEDEDSSLASTLGGQYMEVRVTASPGNAAVYLNGRPLGFAPLTARLEVNRDGDLVDDVVLSAEFSDGGGRMMEQSFTRGTKPPSAVSFSPEGGRYLGR